MSVEQNKAVVRRWHEEVFNGKNLSVVDEILHPDYVRHTDLQGIAAARDWLRKGYRDHPDYQVITEDTIAEGDKVVTRWTAQEGGKARVVGVSIHRIADGKIIEDWAWTTPVS
jgi:predicted SnoaL-like aldol condensation-catalyzing enzyme